jgi:3'(2'), 5'-bisphosphate nucleotidase
LLKGDRLEIKELLSTALRAALKGGNSILRFYLKGKSEFLLKEDKSPLTKADLSSHKEIKETLSLTPYPILSEEDKEIPYSERREWKRFWLIDPLDGTKEFMKRNGEFTVNVALIDRGRPIIGVVYAPAVGELYFAALGLGSFKTLNFKESNLDVLLKRSTKLKGRVPEGRITVVKSRSHPSRGTEEFIRKLKERFGEVREISRGSSLKLCLIAEGKADVYPRFSPTMEWDTAAGQAIVELSGGTLVDVESRKPLTYNKENLKNPSFIALTSGFKEFYPPL